jgi:hypothetical protein
MTARTDLHYGETRPAHLVLSGTGRGKDASHRPSGRVLQAFLDENADLLRMIRATEGPGERRRAERRLYWMALVLGASELMRAVLDLAGAEDRLADPLMRDLGSEQRLAALARLHAAAAEAVAAVAALITGGMH